MVSIICLRQTCVFFDDGTGRPTQASIENCHCFINGEIAAMYDASAKKGVYINYKFIYLFL